MLSFAVEEMGNAFESRYVFEHCAAVSTSVPAMLEGCGELKPGDLGGDCVDIDHR
jgi:hypothetical protein